MDFVRKVFSYTVACLIITLVLFSCVYGYHVITIKYDTFQVAADTPFTQTNGIIVEGFENSEKEYETVIYTETMVVTPSGLTTLGLQVNGGTSSNNNDTATDKPSVNIPSTEMPSVDTGSSDNIVDSDTVPSEPVPGSPLSDVNANALAVENYLKYSSEITGLADKINEYRVQLGLPELVLDYELCIIASHRSTENAWLSWFATAIVDGRKRHIRPNGKVASSIAEFYNLSGTYSENMGRFQRTVDEIFGGWRSSSSHNELMCSTANTHFGIGVASDEDGFLYWTAVFN